MRQRGIDKMSKMTRTQTIVFILLIAIAVYTGQWVANQVIYGQTIDDQLMNPNLTESERQDLIQYRDIMKGLLSDRLGIETLEDIKTNDETGTNLSMYQIREK
jgi:hypothetical protein